MKKTAAPTVAFSEGGDLLPTSTKNGNGRIIRGHYVLTKILLVMKLIIVLLTAAFINVHGAAISQTVTLKGKDIPMATIFSEIEKQTGFVVFSNRKDLEGISPITVAAQNMPLADFLSNCLKGSSLVFVIKGKTVFLSRRSSQSNERQPNNTEGSINSSAPPQLITGKVVDSVEKPLQGVSVRLKPGNKGTSTEVDGSFTIADVRAGEYTLEVSLVGHQSVSRKVTVRESEPLVVGSVVLRVSTQAMEEIKVVYNTGFQEIPKERATGSFVNVDKELINRNPSISNIIDKLDGVTSGLLFDRRPEPNANGKARNRLQIRGLMTLSEEISQPLIVLDNFPYSGDINNINPNDIEFITILRDAAAASIWGAKAANGVIVITSKKGSYNQKLKVSLNAGLSFTGKPDLMKMPILSSSEMIDLEKLYFSKGAYDGIINNVLQPPLTPVAEILLKLRKNQITQQQADEQIDQLRNFDVRNDFLNYIYRTDAMQQYSADFSGGAKNYSYLVGIGYDNKAKELKGDKFDRISFRLSNSFKPLESLELQLGVNYTIINNNNNSLGGFGSQNYRLSDITNLPLYTRLVDENGNNLPVSYKYRSSFTDTAGNGELLDWKYSPLDEIGKTNVKEKGNSILASIGANYKIHKWISADIRYQYQKNQILTNTHYSKDAFYTRDLINLFTNLSTTNEVQRFPVPLGGILDLRNYSVESHGARASLNIGTSIKSVHQINAVIGVNLDHEMVTSNSSRTYGFQENLNYSNVDYVNFYPRRIGLGARIPSFVNFIDQTNRFVSLFSNLGYTYDGRYTLTGSFRRDASNLFGVSTNDKWKPFWSIGTAWNISNESFFRSNIIEQLTLRTTYGYAGNVNNSLSSYYILQAFPASHNELVNASFNSILSAGNPSLRWEKVNTLNFGIDWSLKGQIISGRIEYFTRKAKDVIGAIPLDPTTGFNITNTNSAALKGNGIDLSISSKNFRLNNFKWITSFNLSIAKSKIVRVLQPLATNAGYRSDGSSVQPVEGYNPYIVVSYKWNKLESTTGEPQGMLNGKLSKNYDSIVYFSPFSDQVVHGSAVPELFGNMLNSIEAFGVRISFNITYKFKYYLRKPALSYAGLINGESHIDYRARWQKSGDEQFTNVPSFNYPVSTTRDMFYRNSEINIIKGDHIRMDDVRVSYALENNKVAWLPFRELNFFGYVGNLNILFWKANSDGIDPNFPMRNIGGKTFSFGFNTRF